MKRILVLAVAVLVSLPVFAADRFFDLSANAVWVDSNSSGTFNSTNANQPFDIRFDGKLGYGASANVFFGDHVSLELAASSVKQGVNFTGRTRPAGAGGGDINMIPITGVVQWHFLPNGRIDPYIGAGAAYVLFDNLDSASDFGNLNVSSIDFKDDAGLALNAGLGIGLTDRFGITIDGKYVPLKSNARATFVNGSGGETKVDINPAIFSAGLTFRF